MKIGLIDVDGHHKWLFYSVKDFKDYDPNGHRKRREE